MTTVDELRASMRAAQVAGKGQYFKEGRYLLEVAKLFYKKTVFSDGSATKENIICEFTVLESSTPEIEVGSTRSSVFAFHHKGWLGRFKTLMVALFGVDPDGRIPPECAQAVDDAYVALRIEEERVKMGLPDNFMAGRRVRAEAFPSVSKSTGKPVTDMKWTPVVDAPAQGAQPAQGAA